MLRIYTKPLNIGLTRVQLARKPWSFLSTASNDQVGNTERLSKAAAELVKAAYQDTDTMGITDLTTDMNNKFNTVNQNLEDLKKVIKKEGKKNRLQNAMMLIDSRDKIEMWDVDTTLDSINELRYILSAFMSGNGYHIINYFTKMNSKLNTNDDKEKFEKELHEKLKIEICELTGTEPTFSKNIGGSWCIYYW